MNPLDFPAVPSPFALAVVAFCFGVLIGSWRAKTKARDEVDAAFYVMIGHVNGNSARLLYRWIMTRLEGNGDATREHEEWKLLADGIADHDRKLRESMVVKRKQDGAA